MIEALRYSEEAKGKISLALPALEWVSPKDYFLLQPSTVSLLRFFPLDAAPEAAHAARSIDRSSACCRNKRKGCMRTYVLTGYNSR